MAVTSVNDKLEIAPPPDILQEKTRINALHQVYSAYNSIEQNSKLNINSLCSTSEQIINELMSNRGKLLVQMTDLRLYDDYTFAHSVNVAALSTMIGIMEHLSKQDLMNLTLGALLHDIGKMDIPSKILNKPVSLNDEEFTIIRSHPNNGKTRLLKINDSSIDVSVLAAIAAQHHEHFDGNGYPQKLHGGQINHLSRIVAIADVYDALTSQRAYKKAYHPSIAYKIMTKCSGKQFDKRLLRLFFDHVALYPVGTVVETASGYGIVSKVKEGRTRYPELILFADSNDNLLPEFQTIKTEKIGIDFIVKAMDSQRLQLLINRNKFDPASLLAN